ncbi:histidine phosphatase family protein [Roseomonas sp. OT10]|uniref:histidine phosphatase family protein n=1 Tax=Roseomonas cutis TaxID=2897332 RepID=UPI001E28FCEE|nr:histidine phosphatase family protein [Roseomonas sp. OT10]UFN50210.1 histidine phosphatase family protein [Roseomonas sp. OT10]
MPLTRLFLIRHAIVEPSARLTMYGDMDVALCAMALAQEQAAHAWLAERLPRPARWFCTPLARTRATAAAIFAAGYPEAEPAVLPAMREQNLGEWQGLTHEQFTSMLRDPPHPFWPHSAAERPPGGESVGDVVARVGPVLDGLVADHPDEDLVIVAHGGSIRASLAHACGLDAHQALQFSVRNLSLTRLENLNGDWRVGAVNELPAGLTAAH